VEDLVCYDLGFDATVVVYLLSEGYISGDVTTVLESLTSLGFRIRGGGGMNTTRFQWTTGL